MLPDEVSEVDLGVVPVIIDLRLAKDAENPIGRIGGPASVHVDQSECCTWMRGAGGAF